MLQNFSLNLILFAVINASSRAGVGAFGGTFNPIIPPGTCALLLLSDSGAGTDGFLLLSDPGTNSEVLQLLNC
jgi:hypothetical protein